MSDDLSFLTPQERRLLSLEERVLHAEKQLSIVLNLISDMNDIVQKWDKLNPSPGRLKPLDPQEGGV